MKDKDRTKEQLINELAKLRKEIAELKKSETERRQLTILYETIHTLSMAESLEDLYRRTVEVGRNRLGFDRLRIWSVDEDPYVVVGTFGVDENGQLRDERGFRLKVSPDSTMGQVLSHKIPSILQRRVPLYNGKGEVVGRGDQAIASLWDGKKVIGCITIDNLLQHRPITERERELLALYASAVGHLFSRKRAEKALRESEAKYWNLFENSIEGIGISKGNRVIAANKALLDMFGYKTLEEFIKVPLLGHVAPESREMIKEMIKKRERGEQVVPRYEYKSIRKDGEIRDMEISTAELLIGNEKYVQSTFRDISEWKRTERQLKEREKRYRELWDNAPVAYHTVDTKGIITSVNKTEAKMLGYKPEEMVGRSIFDFILPEQREEAKKRFHKKLAGKRLPKAEDRIYIRKDRSKIYVSIDDVLEQDSDGKVVGVRTTMVDITNLKVAEEKLRKSEERYRRLVENITDVIFTLDTEGCFTYVNPVIEQVFGYKVDEIVNQPFTHFVHPADLRGLQANFKRIMEGEVEPYEFRVLDKNGNIRHVRISICLLLENHQPVGFTGIMTDITQRKQLEESIRQLAYYDPVTGLPNRVLFNNRLAMALTHARREREKLTVMLLDLDRFKDINDSLGHSMGDQLLKSVGNRLKDLLRRSDTVARMGGDEFMVLSPEIRRIGDATILAKKILEAIRKPFILDKEELNITTSIGIAIYPHDAEDADTLMKNVDIAMYYVKNHGRDNYRRYNLSMHDNTL